MQQRNATMEINVSCTQAFPKLVVLPLHRTGVGSSHRGNLPLSCKERLARAGVGQPFIHCLPVQLRSLATSRLCRVRGQILQLCNFFRADKRFNQSKRESPPQFLQVPGRNLFLSIYTRDGEPAARVNTGHGPHQNFRYLSWSTTSGQNEAPRYADIWIVSQEKSLFIAVKQRWNFRIKSIDFAARRR